MSLPVTVALVDDTKNYSHAELNEIAMALNQQIVDLRHEWGGPPAHVGLPPTVTANMWSLVIRAQLDEPGALGYHTDAHNVPVSYIEFTGKDETPVTLSHELCEMLVDPWGNRMHGAQLPGHLQLDHRDFGMRTQSEHVHYLLEVCDPCERTSYKVNGIAVSDFLLPAWYRTNPKALAMYSFIGSLDLPREVDDGGYVSFANNSGEWYQIFVQNGKTSVSDLGTFDKAAYGSLRAFTDEHSRLTRAEA